MMTSAFRVFSSTRSLPVETAQGSDLHSRVQAGPWRYAYEGGAGLGSSISTTSLTAIRLIQAS